MRNTKECSMSYRQSEMYKLTTYLKDLPLQSVSSKKESSGLPPEDSFLDETDCSGKSLRYVVNLYIYIYVSGYVDVAVSHMRLVGALACG